MVTSRTNNHLREQDLAMIHKHILLSVLWLSGVAAACGQVSTKQATQETASPQGKHCGKQSSNMNGFAERYISASKEMRGELWTELEFYECSVKGSVLVDGSEFRYDINASGAGILWQQTKTAEVKRYFYCDSGCRKSVRWPFGDHFFQ